MKFSIYTKVLLAGLILALGVLVGTYRPDGATAFAQAPATAPVDTGVDPYDRNAMLWANQRSGYKSGWQRGREIYYMRCWMCHSEYVTAADTFPTPSLRDVAKRMTDQQITAVVRAGTARMPSYSPEELPEADVKDLLSLFREKCGTFPMGGGCFDEPNPPPNPSYRFGRETSNTP
jgi:hypothetical protein